jgi:drug/metabolite transporter (DMT)-like permease
MTSDSSRPLTVNPARGIALFLLTGAGFAVLDTTAKYLTHDYSVIQIAWSRYVFAVLFMALFMTRGRNPLATVKLAWQVARGLLLMMITTLFFLVFSYMPQADATAIGFISPLIVTALGALVLHEKVGPRRWTAVAVGFAGVLIIMQPGAGTFHWVALVAVLMAASNAVFQIITRIVSRYDSAFVSSFYGAAVGAVVLSMIVPFVWRWPDLWGWMLMVGIGAVGALAHYCFAAALGYAPASMLAPYAYFQLVWATINGYLVFGDVPGVTPIIGGLVIVASGVYVFSREAKLRKPVVVEPVDH